MSRPPPSATLSEHTTRDDVVLTDIYTSWYVPIFGDRVIATPSPSFPTTTSVVRSSGGRIVCRSLKLLKDRIDVHLDNGRLEEIVDFGPLGVVGQLGTDRQTIQWRGICFAAANPVICGTIQGRNSTPYPGKEFLLFPLGQR